MFERESRKGVTRDSAVASAAAAVAKAKGAEGGKKQATASGSSPASPAEGMAADFVEALAYSREHYVVMLGEMVDKPKDPEEVAKVWCCRDTDRSMGEASRRTLSFMYKTRRATNKHMAYIYDTTREIDQ